MNIPHATEDYETWLGGQVRLVQSDLGLKHELMAQDAFSFLRATFYRWIQLFPLLCPKLADAPTVLAVGDLHVENYGTWRDAEGRLVWGINDFDEAFPLPYTSDLVRLATSVGLSQLSLDPAEAGEAILAGYFDGLENGGRPFVLSETNRWLRDAVTSGLRDPTLFWEKLAALPTVKRVPAEVMSLLKDSLPERGLDFRVAQRQAGLGSLGRERFTAITEWRGGNIAREAKALAPSASVWPGGLPDKTIYYGRVLQNAVRASDPFVQVRGKWVLRRLSPYCSRIELAQLPRGHDEEKLLRAMGRELANVHLGSAGGAAPIRSCLELLPDDWLRTASCLAATRVQQDYETFLRGS